MPVTPTKYRHKLQTRKFDYVPVFIIPSFPLTKVKDPEDSNKLKWRLWKSWIPPWPLALIPIEPRKICGPIAIIRPINKIYNQFVYRRDLVNWSCSSPAVIQMTSTTRENTKLGEETNINSTLKSVFGDSQNGAKKKHRKGKKHRVKTDKNRKELFAQMLHRMEIPLGTQLIAHTKPTKKKDQKEIHRQQENRIKKNWTISNILVHVHQLIVCRNGCVCVSTSWRSSMCAIGLMTNTWTSKTELF